MSSHLQAEKNTVLASCENMHDCGLRKPLKEL